MNEDVQISDFKNVVDKVHSTCLDQESYNLHQKQGTLDEHYNKLLQTMIADVLRVSVLQIQSGFSPLDSSTLVANTFSEVTKIMGIAFGRSRNIVAADIAGTLERFPTEDYRTAVLLREQKSLH
jgi:hypothetical protein